MRRRALPVEPGRAARRALARRCAGLVALALLATWTVTLVGSGALSVVERGAAALAARPRPADDPLQQLADDADALRRSARDGRLAMMGSAAVATAAFAGVLVWLARATRQAEAAAASAARREPVSGHGHGLGPAVEPWHPDEVDANDTRPPQLFADADGRRAELQRVADRVAFRLHVVALCAAAEALRAGAAGQGAGAIAREARTLARHSTFVAVQVRALAKGGPPDAGDPPG